MERSRSLIATDEKSHMIIVEIAINCAPVIFSSLNQLPDESFGRSQKFLIAKLILFFFLLRRSIFFVFARKIFLVTVQGSANRRQNKQV